MPWLPPALASLFPALLLYRPVWAHPALVATLLAVPALFLVWWSIVYFVRRRGANAFRIEFHVVRAHYVQAAVQLCIYAFWGWYSRTVYTEAPLILSQVAFLYLFDALMSWSRGRAWRIGFGPFPVVFSTNLLMWFRADWYYLQYLMLTAGALGKEFLRWRRDGQWTHVFNPSVFGQALFGIALILTGMTTKLTAGEELALAFESMAIRHMHVVLFLLGLVVQYLFSVTLVTMSAVLTLCLLNLAFQAWTGTYYFITLNVGATVFLGMHLLVTDPATSPRTNIGRVVFGAGYAVGYFGLSGLFANLDVPLFWDKLLPVPILNLCVPLFDRLARGGFVGRWNAAWESALPAARMNLVHMGVWAALFTTLVATGYVGHEHEGRNLAYWKKAYDQGRFHAGEKMMVLVRQRLPHSGEANNVMGLLLLEGRIVPKNEAAAVHYFARACDLGEYMGCENVASQFLFAHRAESPDAVARAFDCLERERDRRENGAAHLLLGLAHAHGFGRTQDPILAVSYLDEACRRGLEAACKEAARLRAVHGLPPGPEAAGDSARASTAPENGRTGTSGAK